jgi:hypothetical protein
MRRIIGSTALALLLTGCGGTGIPSDGNIQAEDPAEGGISDVPNPDAAMAQRSGKPLATLKSGYDTYMLKCGECHYYMLPDKIDVDEWEEAMPKMIRHAGLSAEDEKQVLTYVLAVKGE